MADGWSQDFILGDQLGEGSTMDIAAADLAAVWEAATGSARAAAHAMRAAVEATSMNAAAR